MLQDDEDDLDINEQYANTKIQLTDLEKLLPNTNNNDDDGKKKKKKKSVAGSEIHKQPIVLTDAQLEKTRKDVKKLKDKLASLEADWDFDKRAAQDIYAEKVKVIAEKERQEQREAQAQLKKKQQEEAEALATKEPSDKVDGDNDEDEEGGLFGGLMMGEEEEADIMANTTSLTSTSVNWHIVDLSVPKSYVGRYPKDIMLDHCNKQKLGRISYNATNEGSDIWRATIKIAKEGHSLSLKYELPEATGASSKQDAIQLTAVSAQSLNKHFIA